MPDNNQTKEGQEDLKEGENQTSGDDQTGKGDEGDKGEETVTMKKSELNQIESDLDNYRKATLEKKSKEREFKQQAKEGDKEEESGGAGSGTTTIDEARATEIVRKEVTSFQERTAKSNQQRAQKSFLLTNKEYLDDALWTDLMSDFRAKGNEMTVDDYLDSLNETLLVHKKRTGKLDEYLASERERGRQEGRTEAEAGSGRQAGGVGDKNEGQPSGQLSEKGKEIAKGVKVDPEKVEKVDPSKDNVIDVS